MSANWTPEELIKLEFICTYKGNPIIGDKLYRKKNKKFKKIDMELNSMIKNIDRQFLHAKSLGFVHPSSNKEVHFENSITGMIY